MYKNSKSPTGHDISVAIATYRGGKYLLDQLNSILTQTERPAAIIISDDGSDDDTVKVAQSCSEESCIPIHIYENERGLQKPGLGVIRNFLTAFEKCQTEWICYCDQDDVWDAGRVECILKVLASDRDDSISLVYHQSELVDGALRSSNVIHPNGVRGAIFHKPLLPIAVWGYGHQMIFKKEVLDLLKDLLNDKNEELRFVQSNLDIALLVAAGMVGRVVFIPKPLIKFRRHSDTVSPAGKINTEKHCVRDRTSHLRSWKAAIPCLLRIGRLRLDDDRFLKYSSTLALWDRLLQKKIQLYASESAFFTRCKAWVTMQFLRPYSVSANVGWPLRHIFLDLARLCSRRFG